MTGDDLREVMRRHPVGVSVVTVDREGERLGLTVASLVSVALEPPLVAISIGHQAAFHELLRGAGGFGVSLLGANQVALAQHFARGVPPIAHWTGIETTAGELGAPLIEGALGWVECRIAFEREVGDHTLFVGEAVSVRRGPGREALVHLRRAYT